MTIAPELKPGNIVVLDDLPAHRVVSDLLTSLALAEIVVTGWEGVDGDDDEPAPVDRKHLAAFLQDDARLERFKELAYGEVFFEAVAAEAAGLGTA
ncbi:MAG: hypothetical protein H0T75_19810 [Rhizobiales bacterium]|nr:hypothetical protein [Hyphomicrobiales bacterium]